MALNPKLTNQGANAEVDALAALFNGGYLELYDGVQPTLGDDAITTQVRLASLQFGSPAFAAGVAGVAAANTIAPETDAPNTGTATWYRCYKSGHVPGSDESDKRIMDGSVGTINANLNLTVVDIQAHAEVRVDAFLLQAKKTG